MNAWTYPLLAIALLTSVHARAQTTAEDYFNKAAREYVKEEKIAALRTLDQGLRAHPGDARMRNLAEAIMKEQQQQQQQQSAQQQQQQEKQQQEQQQNQQEQSGQQEQQAQESDPGEQREGEERQARKGELTKEEAERILDALDRREQDVQQQARARMRPARKSTSDKDW